MGFEVINLGGHETIKMNELIQMIERMTGRKASINHLPFNPADMMANWANVEKARQLLNWAPEVSLAEGVANLVKWYQTEKEWVSQIDTN
jgi:UDP-glucuronate 4-epimerase